VKRNDHYSPNRVKPKYTEPDFRFRTYISEKQRVEESVCKSSFLDPVPILKKKVQIRERMKEKDINPVFRFQANTNSERVLDYIRGNAISQFQTPTIFKQIRSGFVDEM